MTLFAGRDRAGTNFDWKGDGTAAAFLLQVAVITAIPTPLGHVAGTATTSSQTLAAATAATLPATATHVRIDVPSSASGDIIYTLDASVPTATVGELIPAGGAGEIALASLANVRLRSSAGTIAFSASYRKYT